MRYFLVNDLGRLVGQVERKRGSGGGIAEYGARDRDGILHVQGHAKLCPPSSFSGVRLQEMELDPPRLWD
jgi:hypothetical protein